MFDNLSKSEQTKKNETVDDIFADTDQGDLPNDATKMVTQQPNSSAPTMKSMPTMKLSSEAEKLDPQIANDPLMADEEEVRAGGSNKIMKPLIIVLIVVLLAGGAYFALRFFGVLDQFSESTPATPIVTDSNQNLDDFDDILDSPEFIDPFLLLDDEEDLEDVVILPDIIDEDEYIEPLDPAEIKISWRDVPLLDSDNDGLSDITEELIGADPFSADTDGDGYSDYQELMNGYNPLDEGTLPPNFSVLNFTDSGLSFFYSPTWSVNRLNDNTWQLKSPIDQTSVKITREQNQLPDIFTWYASTFSDLNPVTSDRLVYNSQLGAGIVTVDGFNLMFASADNNYILRLFLEIDNNDINHSGPLALFINTLSQQ